MNEYNLPFSGDLTSSNEAIDQPVSVERQPGSLRPVVPANQERQAETRGAVLAESGGERRNVHWRHNRCGTMRVKIDWSMSVN